MKRILYAPLYLVYGLILTFGNNAYRVEQYDTATLAYELADMYPDAEALSVEYNKASVAYRQGDYDKSIEILDHVIEKTNDDSLKQKSYYNKGNNLYKIGESQIQSGREIEGVTNWIKAIGEYENALKIDPGDVQAKENIEFIKELLKNSSSSVSTTGTPSGTPTPRPESEQHIKKQEIKEIQDKELENLKNFKIEDQLRRYDLNFDKEEEYW